MKTITASTTTIVALDLAKYKTVACLYDGDPASARFQSVTTCRAELVRLLAAHAGAAVVIEACALSMLSSSLTRT